MGHWRVLSRGRTWYCVGFIKIILLLWLEWMSHQEMTTDTQVRGDGFLDHPKSMEVASLLIFQATQGQGQCEGEGSIKELRKEKVLPNCNSWNLIAIPSGCGRCRLLILFLLRTPLWIFRDLPLPMMPDRVQTHQLGLWYMTSPPVSGFYLDHLAALHCSLRQSTQASSHLWRLTLLTGDLHINCPAQLRKLWPFPMLLCLVCHPRAASQPQPVAYTLNWKCWSLGPSVFTGDVQDCKAFS